MKIIGFAGMARAGKNESADYVCKKLGKDWVVSAFADNVKRIFCETFGVDRVFTEEWKIKPENPPGFDMSCRKALQFIGDGFRQIRHDIWVDLLFRRAKEQSQNTVIADVRYVNELLEVKKYGGINVLLYRPGFTNDDPNPSEAIVRNITNWFLQKEGEPPPGAELIDLFLVNDGTLENLYGKIDELVLPLLETKNELE